LIKSNGIKINNQLENNEKFIINDKLFLEKKFIKLSIGKKKHYKIVI
jgi:tyrosyl-tRNA synthetase